MDSTLFSFGNFEKHSNIFENSDSFSSNKKDIICKNKTSPKTSSLLRHKKTILEKKRRDKLCETMKNLATIVPIVSMSEKKISKADVLRLSSSYLKLHNGFANHLKSSNGWRPRLSDGNQWQQLLQSAVGGFLVIVKECGEILYVSDGVKTTLGHSVGDVIGHRFYSLIHRDDRENVESHIQELFKTDDKCLKDGRPNERCDVMCSMQCNKYPFTSNHYEPVHILGHLKPVGKYEIDCSKIDKYFIGIVKNLNLKPFEGLELDRNLRFFSATTTLDGHVLQIDPQFSLILGHLPSEMIGVSGYDLIFHEDIPLGLLAHRQMLMVSDVIAHIIRLLTRNNTLIFFISVMKTVLSSDGLGKPEHASVLLSVISNDHGERIMAFMRKRLMPYVGTKGLIQFNNIIRAFERGKDTDSLMAMMGIETEKRPRGRPRKTGTEDNFKYESDFLSWVRNFETNSNPIGLREACKQIVQKDVQHIMESYESLRS